MSSDVGILAGDPGSPLLWILFVVDCLFSEHADDVFLDSLLGWCAENGLEVCSYKSKGLLFLPPHMEPPASPPQIHAAGEQIPFVTEVCYVGMTFSTSPSTFRAHAVIKAEAAKKVANRIFAARTYVNDLWG